MQAPTPTKAMEKVVLLTSAKPGRLSKLPPPGKTVLKAIRDRINSLLKLLSFFGSGVSVHPSTVDLKGYVATKKTRKRRTREAANVPRTTG